MSEELKPCPFCGGDASGEGSVRYTSDHDAWFADGTRIREAFFANCLSCGATNKGMIGHQTKDKAIEHWNRRADSDRIATLTADKKRLMLDNASWESTCNRLTDELSEAKAEVERLSRRSVMALAADHENLREYLGQLEQERDSLAQRLAKWKEAGKEMAAAASRYKELRGFPKRGEYLNHNNFIMACDAAIAFANAIAAFERLQKEEAKS